jgi:uncharacterized phage infection (PIP) family protein YhgE
MIGEGIADVIDSLNPFKSNVDDLSDSAQEAAAQVYALTQVITGLNTGIGNLFGTIQKWASHPIVGTILRSLPGVGPAFQVAVEPAVPVNDAVRAGKLVSLKGFKSSMSIPYAKNFSL